MTAAVPVTPIRQEVTVAVPQAHAFRVFTERFDAWWPRSHYVGPGELAEAVIEPHEGGRWYCRSTDGSEGLWGEVIVWSPPDRVVLTWQLDVEYHYDPDLHTEVEVSFAALEPNRTRVVLEHRLLENYGGDAAKVRGNIGNEEGGWGGLLRIFASTAERLDR